MLTRSQAVLMNNYLKKEDNDGVAVNMVLRNGTVVPKNFGVTVTLSRIFCEAARGNVTLPCVPEESPTEGGDLNRQRCRKPEGCFTIIRTRSQAHKKLKVDTSYGKDDVPSPPHAPSGTRMAKYVVDIDFDEASREWRRNKRSMGNGCYSYK